MPPDNTVPLSTLGPGDAARVADVTGAGAFRRRLMDMGFVSGAFVRVIRHAPLRNPTEYCVGGSHVTLRSSEASHIIVSPAPAPPWCRERPGRGLGRFLRRRKRGGRGRGRRGQWKKRDDES